MGTVKDSDKTKAKLIEAAGRLFAMKGLKGVTVREIAKEAQTHLSALNYHFHSKKDLYREVLLEACRELSISSEEQKLLLQMDPTESLHLIIIELIKGYNKGTKYYWQPVIIARESWDPSNMFDEIAEQYWKPDFRFMARIIGSVVDKPANDRLVLLSTITMIGILDTFGIYHRFVYSVAPELSGLTEKMLEAQIFDTVICMARGNSIE
jgi:TetR/AcrR family transcriptional regulator, regulator of cefoperazone and chloramphenicol sensitivity